MKENQTSGKELSIKNIHTEGLSDDELLLFECLGLLENTHEIYAFFKDLCTPQEIKAMTERWSIAMELGLAKKSYKQVQKSTGAGTTTISRVGRFLKDENYNGYQLILNRIKKNIKKSKSDE